MVLARRRAGGYSAAPLKKAERRGAARAWRLGSMVKRKIKRKARRGVAKIGLQDEAKRVLEQCLERMEPKPTPAIWKRMARGMAEQKNVGGYFDDFVREHGELGVGDAVDHARGALRGGPAGGRDGDL